MNTKRNGADPDRLRVLVELASSDTRIGAVNDALDLAHFTAPLGVSVTLCGRLDGAFRALARQRGIPVVRGQSRIISKLGLPLYAASVLFWVAQLVRLRPHVVHLNYPGYAPSLALAARFCGVPVVCRAGGEFNSRNLANRWVRAYVANCEPHARSLLDSPLADKVHVVGDLFRTERLAEPPRPVRPLPPRREGRPRFLFLGQLVERKGVKVLVEAFARMQADADLLLVGGVWDEPGYPREVRDRLERLSLGGRVHCENHRPDVAALLTDSDVFVLPSLSEARPRSIIEAMFLGRPVVATAVGGIPTLVEDGVTGLLVAPNDPQALAAALDSLARSADLRQRLAEAGRRRALAEFDPTRTAGRYVALYRGLAGMGELPLPATAQRRAQAASAPEGCLR